MKNSFLVTLRCYELSKKQTHVVQGSGQDTPTTRSIRGQFGQGNQFPFLSQPD